MGFEVCLLQNSNYLGSMHNSTMLNFNKCSKCLQNGEFVKGDERVVVDGTLGEINFKPLKEEDAGTYTCKAHNDVGEALANGSLNVLG